MKFQELFKMGMDREVGEIKNFEAPRYKLAQDHHALPVVLNLGAGEKHISGSIPLDYPEWDADKDPILYNDSTVDGIYAFHFLEHVKEPVRVLQEMQRVLRVGGLVNIVVPYYTSQMYAHDLDHKHPFCEDTWKILFRNPYYDKNKIEWKFKENFNMIAGIVERNLALFTQLEKVA